ncbi:MAG: M36 family metallopeptidase [Saprospiraceae bacterium]|nr:M36 family metallopeptidase [Saprospiraceae bacterium]
MNAKLYLQLGLDRLKAKFFTLIILFFSFQVGFSQISQSKVETYLKNSKIQYGLEDSDINDFEITSEHVSTISNVLHIYFTQRKSGIQIYSTESSIHFYQSGNLLNDNNHFLYNTSKYQIDSKNPVILVEDAVEAAAAELGLLSSGEIKTKQVIGGEDKETILEKGNIAFDDIKAKLKYLPSFNQDSRANSPTKNELKLVWEIYLYEITQKHYWHILLDASSGKILFKNDLILNCDLEHNFSKHDHSNEFPGYYEVPTIPTPAITNASVAMIGAYRVYAMPVESPGHGPRTLVANPDNALASPFGWHDTNGAPGNEFTITRGNNTHAYEDGNNPGFSPDGGAGVNFDFPINTNYQMGIDESEPAAITNLFYWTNIIHDVLYQYGFTESAGNFQVNNYGRGGLGNDDVRAEAQDASGTCNANFGTPPDGSRPTMQMYVCGNRDGDLDNAVIVHEYGHGISNRLTGGPGNVGCLGNQEQMGEGWSDWYGLVLTIEPGDQGTDSRGIGTWLFGQAPNGPGIRPFPYSTNLAVNPHTYDAIKLAAVPHGVGSVWCAMLWEMTWALINQYGYSSNFYTGNGGNNRAMALVTEAMKLQPCSPGFVDGRNAILRADTALYGGANACLIWTAFAKRGLGFSANQGSSNSRSDGTEAFDIPQICQAQAPNTTCFNFTGGMQTWTVPAGVTSITIEAWGAEGGSAPNNQGSCGNLTMGGDGGFASGTLAVTPGQVLNLFVGGRGFNGAGAGGFNGGGSSLGRDNSTCASGGGASDVRVGGVALGNRVIVAAGGGGAEWSGRCQQAGQGGGLNGGVNGFGDNTNPANNGGPASQASGGFAGSDACGNSLNTVGTLGIGGSATLIHSGAGGGGYFGGGGAGCDGHGGGGSSYIGGVTGGTTTPGLRIGDGQICITYGAASGLPTITCPAPLFVSCAIDVPAPNINLPVVGGGCRAPLVVSWRRDSITNQTCANRFIIHRIYRVTDPCGAFAECIQLITVNDVTSPSPFCPANQNLQCASAIPPINTASVVVADGCGNAGIVVVHVSDTRVNQTCTNRFTLNRIYRATDVCGNSATCLQVFTVNDNTAPTLTCRNLTLYLSQNGTVVLTPSNAILVASDNCTPTAQLVFGASITNFTCANIGPNQVTISATDECLNTGNCLATITVLDTIAPVIMGCPVKSPVTLNLGPGACEISWDVPPFMAMDNCPGLGRFFGARNTTTVCLPPASYWSITGGAGSWGVMFDLINTSGSPLNLQLLGERAFANVPHRIWYKTTPGGHAPVQGTPSAWTLCATRTPTGGAQFTTVIDSFRLLTGVVRDTMVSCTGTRIDSAQVGCLTMLPGETRGIYIHAPGTIGTNASLFTGCQPAQMGNAQITTPLNGATYTGGEFAAPFINSSFGFGGANWIGVIGYNLGATTNMVPLTQTCGAPYGPGCFFPIGCTRLCYEARDASGNIGRCEFEVCVNPYPNPITELACNDEIQISLDDSCLATINPDMVLEGGPYSCYDDYIVTVRDWNTNVLIDRLPNRPGIQLDRRDIGRHLRITITDPRTGNSCWGQATVEDKLAPILTCPPDITVACDEGTSPSVTGIPSVYENCGGVSLSYRDQSSQGSCELGYQNRIIRTWTAEDSYGNRSVCVQNIEESLGDLFSVTVPPNFDNLDQPILNCDEKIDRNKNIVPHMSDNPECVDGYLLDSAYWYARPNQLNIYPNRRIPRVLGWNCIDDPNDVHFGHPSPDPVYYPQHRSWQPNNPLCWGPDTHIMWIGTGRPGGTNSCNNLAVTYKDILFDLATAGCDAGPIGCYKVLRQWTVMDWCTSLVGGHSQIIKVGDLEGPQVLYPDSVRVNMDSYICAGRWEVSPPWLLDNCSNELHYSVEVEQGTVLGNETTGFVVIDMPEGIQNAWIVAEDCCGNITRKHLTINVVDRVPPTPICRSWTSVSINGNQSPLDNYARIYAEDLDEASYDNCAPHVYFKVIRMAELLGTNNGSNSNNTVACAGRNGDDNLILTGNQVYFDDYTDFCCADVGQRIMVVLRVFDIDPGAGPVTPVRMTSTTQPLHGRFSDCMVEVDVQNKAVPTVIAPPNIVVSCWFWFDINNLTNPNDETFGKVVTDLTLRRKVVTKDLVCRKYCERNDYTGYPGFVQSNANPKPAPNQACDYYFAYFDTAHWDRKYELTWGFDGYVLAPCGATPTITVNDLRECGQGIIQRIVSAQGPNNINVTAIQTIWVVDCDPFYIDDLTCNDPRFSDVIWPNGICTQTPVTLNGCGADISPDNPQLGRPQIINNADDNCALLSIEYRDEVFTIEPDACLKVLRTWTIIDWCQYDPFIDPDNGRWERLQVIKVRDQDRPVVTCNVGPCEPASIHPTLGVCVGHISLTASATDNCTPIDWLFWEYKIDAYNDRKGVHGGWDFRVGTLTEKQFNAGDTVEYSHNPFADNPRNPFNASGTYPIGIHRINWYVEDGCGNVGTCETLFEIRDCKAPTPYCLTGIISVPMPSSGCVSIWAKDLDKGSFDNCTSQDNLKFYFDNDPNKTSIEICCEDFVNAKVDDELILSVEMCVEDEEGNKDCCITTIVIQDNQDLCPNGGSFGKVTGNILTSTGNGTDETQVELKRAGNLMKEMVTSTDGKYAFYTLDMYQNYIVKPTRDDDHLNGVTTADIIRIQRHILGQDVISDPYLLIAADVNKSNSVTSADITEIRKLILGSISRFSKVPSWTFVPKDYVFANPAQPFQYEAYGSLKLDDPDMTLDFVSIKLGDVTNSARSNVNSKVSARTSSTLLLEFDDQILQAGQSYSIPVRSNNFHQIRGMQYTLRFDKQALQYLGTKGLALDISEPNTGINRIDDGILTMSWNQHQAISLSSQENLFELNFTANQNGRLSEMIMINSDLTQAEAYNQNSDILNVSLLSRNGTTSSQTGIFELYQNEPNPFNKQTVIKYLLPTDGPVTLTVYDISGKVLRVIQQDAHKGLNQLIIQKSEIGRSGIFYYQLDANDHTDTRKLVIID